MQGRWTTVVCPNHGLQKCGCYQCDDWQCVPVVPCDDAAIERAALALYADERGEDLRPDAALPPRFRRVASLCLRAAGETP